MRLLLDTHALLWWLDGGGALADEARRAVADPGNSVHVSAASAWEIAIKKALGKLAAPGDLAEAVEASRMVALAVTITHAEAVGDLPHHHGDPFDRMLIAQAQLEGLTIVTRNARFADYGVRVLEA